jgi:hypothetical protein
MHYPNNLIWLEMFFHSVQIKLRRFRNILEKTNNSNLEDHLAKVDYIFQKVNKKYHCPICQKVMGCEKDDFLRRYKCKECHLRIEINSQSKVLNAINSIYRCGICHRWIMFGGGISHRSVTVCSNCYHKNRSFVVAELCKVCIKKLQEHLINWDEFNIEKYKECSFCRKLRKNGEIIYKSVLKGDSVRMDVYKDKLTIIL